MYNLIPRLFSIIKRRGALLAEWGIAGIKFDTLFSDKLFFENVHIAIETAEKFDLCI